MHSELVPLTNTTWDNPRVSPEVTKAIQSAARASSVDPHLLSAIAWRESRFDPLARSHRSSATGLLQFTTGTWLQVMREFGSQVGLADYASAVHRDRFGTLVVTETRVRMAILKLRSDPVLSAKLAGASMGRQRDAMQDQLGRAVTPVDLYLSHVLGPIGASRFLTAVVQRPTLSSIEVASAKVMRNAGLLARDGRPMTVANTYAAVETMLNAQRAHSESLLRATAIDEPSSDPRLTEVSQAPD